MINWVLVSCYCVASVISILVVVLKLGLFIRQLRERRAGLDVLSGEHTEHLKKLAKHRKQLTKTQRSLYMIYASIAVGVAENVPIGVLQGKITSGMSWISLCACMCLGACARPFAIGSVQLHAHAHAVCCAVIYLLRTS